LAASIRTTTPLHRARNRHGDYIEITMFAGRSIAAKRALYQAVVRRLAAFDVPPEDVKILLRELPPENVGLRGGQAASDIDIGYAIKV
jgi:phenylpyruvate tautomerase PptA (4-oxalocrotonate tautomerase family)